MRKFKPTIILVAILAILLSSSTHAYAQAWKLFTDTFKRDAKKEEPVSETEAVDPSFEQSPSEAAQGLGLLDFSNALQDDASNLTGSAPIDEEDVAILQSRQTQEEFAPPLPSYRNRPEQRADAALNDVFFISANVGWAVGDRGVVLKSVDGGETWNLCETNVDANLFAVSFFDERYGLAVGGRVMPSTKGGLGVILRTIDGGVTWGEVEHAAFPILRDVKILDPQTAWIAGDSSTMYPSGLFVSEDTGVSWIAESGSKHSGWRSILYDPAERLGAGVTMRGELQTVSGDALRRPLDAESRSFADSAYDASTGTAWAVGSEGLVMRSDDFGQSWRYSDAPLPDGTGDYFDLASVSARDGKLAAVGSPGSLVFSSSDGGASWRSHATGSTAPMRRVFFLDANLGWCVGDLGTIASTRDGGETWRVVRRGGSRVALLGLFARIDDVPLSVFAQLAAEDGYLSEIEIVAREARYEDASEEATRANRLYEAAIECGCVGATQGGRFPIASREERDAIDQAVARLDAVHDGKGRLKLRESLVRTLRTWRPDALLTLDATEKNDAANAPAATLQGGYQPGRTPGLVPALASDAQKLESGPRDAFQELLLTELASAIRDAADPTAFPEHLTACGLEPWRVKKARILCRGASQWDMTIDDGSYCPNLGRAVGEISRRANAILATDATLPGAFNLQTLFTVGAPKNANKTFFDGLEIPYGGDSRRARPSVDAESSERCVARAAARRSRLAIAQNLAKQSRQTPQSADLFLGQLNDSLRGVDVDLAVEYITTSGKLFAAIGAWRPAAEIFASLSPTLYSDPQSREALAWLMQYYCGSEPERRVLAQGGSALDDEPGGRLKEAQILADRLRENAPDAFMAPEIRFPFAVAQLASGDYQGAMRFYLARSQSSVGGSGTGGGKDDVWAVRAAAEYWLRAPDGDIGTHKAEFCPLSVATCRAAIAKPFLDGVLEPETWDAAAELRLSEPYPDARSREATPDGKLRDEWRAKNRAFSSDLGARLYFLVDSEYLYIAGRCPKVRGYRYATRDDKETRPRDANLSQKDRVEVAIDIDGDYATSCNFVVDCNGWLADSMWNDASWNPPIFLARHEESDEWSFETAIPLSSFASAPPRPGASWRMSARRVVPGVGVECWNVENSDRGEKAFGVLQFE